MLSRTWKWLLQQLISSWRYWRSQAMRPSLRELLISMLGASLGLLLTSISSHYFLGNQHPWFMASIGGSAVLLFALPASPVAQPWPVLLGTLISVAVGVACCKWLGPTEWSASLAGGLAVGLMLFFRCLHPPAGAVAISAVVGGPQIVALGYWYILWPALPNTLLILLSAIAFNNVVGRRYPHRSSAAVQTHHTQDPPPTQRGGFSVFDVRAVLAQQHELPDISPDDVTELLQAVHSQARLRSSGAPRCGDIMSRDLVHVASDASLQSAWDLLCAHRIATLPVVDDALHLIGILALHDFVLNRDQPQVPRHVDMQAQVGSLMTLKVISVTPDTTLDVLVRRSADGGLHHIPVINPVGKLVGIITQSDILAALYRETAWQPSTAPRAAAE